MKNAFLKLTLGLLTIVAVGCSDDEVTPQGNLEDIVGVAQANGFNSLAAALTRADLIGALQGDGPFTVFAPSDEAFNNLLTEIGQSSIDDIPVSILTDILKYHVVSGSIASTDITDGDVTSLQGTSLSLTTSGGIKVNTVSVSNTFDVPASNGIIHAIEGVLVPSEIGQFVNTVLEPAYFNNSFTTLVSAVVKADLTNTLLTTPDLTIFAPSNAAFDAAGINIDDVSSEDLVNILAYHVITSKVLSNGIPNTAETFGGESLNFSLTANGNFINGSTEIVAVDIESGSGVVHVLGNVLMPPSGTIVDIAIGNEDFTSLVAALTRTTTEGDMNLVEVLNGDGPFTVFAPTNAAFQALLDSNDSWNALGDIPIGTLVEVLTYHVVGARAYDVDLSGTVDLNNAIQSVQGTNLTFDLSSLMINNEVNIVGTNITANNGVIHVIDKVLLP